MDLDCRVPCDALARFGGNLAIAHGDLSATCRPHAFRARRPPRIGGDEPPEDKTMRTNEEGVSPVIATILMVAITVVLAAVLYVMVTNLLRPIDVQRPLVTVGSLGCDATACRGRVTEASPAAELGRYRVTVFADGDRATAPPGPAPA